ncbi:hypothetical protein Tco_1470448, partial [Tanacetum coccineum]
MVTPPIGYSTVKQTPTPTEEEEIEEMKNSVISRTSSAPPTVARRRSASSLCRSQSSLGREIGHAASETYLITRLAFTLLRYLGVGRRWISRLLALGLYAMFLMPGFLQ